MKKTAWLCAFLLVAIGLFPAQAPSTAPAAEWQAKGWLTAFNSGARPTFLDFLQKYRPSDVGHIDGLLAFRARTGGFELIKTEESTPTRFAALVKEKGSD